MSVPKNQLLRSVAPAQLELNFDLPFRPLPGHEPLLTIPSYRLGNGRIRLRASDIDAAIEASRGGGDR
jgi:hypothetical protein